MTLRRHAASCGNVAGRADDDAIADQRGTLLDVPLTDTGMKDARGVGERTSSEAYDIVLASELTRAIQTAVQILRGSRNPRNPRHVTVAPYVKETGSSKHNEPVKCTRMRLGAAESDGIEIRELDDRDNHHYGHEPDFAKFYKWLFEWLPRQPECQGKKEVRLLLVSHGNLIRDNFADCAPVHNLDGVNVVLKPDREKTYVRETTHQCRRDGVKISDKETVEVSQCSATGSGGKLFGGRRTLNLDHERRR